MVSGLTFKRMIGYDREMRSLGIGLLLSLIAMLPKVDAQVHAANRDLFTNVYAVPPTFLAMGAAALAQGPDPFAPPLIIRPNRGGKPTAKSVLESAGITFGVGASAIYNPKTSQLIVRNTQDQIELVEAYLEAIKMGGEQQMRLEFRMVALNDIPASDELFNLLRPGGAICRAAPPTFDFPEDFLAELTEKSKPIAGVTREIIGTFSEEKTAAIFESLENKVDPTYLKLTTKLCRSGQWNVVEIGERRVGISTVFGANAFAVDLHAFLPTAATPFEADIVKGHAIPDAFSETISDGHTMAIAEKGPDKRFEVLFISSVIVDARGKPVRKVGARSHVVETNETLDSIAAVYGFDAAKILEINRLPDDEVAVGEILLLPPPARPDPATEHALKHVILPEIDFDDTEFSDALEFLKSESLRVTEGTDIIVPRVDLRRVEDLADERLTLRLKNVPLSEALRYTTSLMRCKFEIEGESVVVVPLEAN